MPVRAYSLTRQYHRIPFTFVLLFLINTSHICVVCGKYFDTSAIHVLESRWNVMVHGDAREGKWRGNWRMEWVESTLRATSGHGVSSITTADAHNSAASSRPNWRAHRFKWTRPFPGKTKSGFCTCAITFQTQSTKVLVHWQSNFKIVNTFEGIQYKMCYKDFKCFI
jgi:hypothetical protein